MSNMIYFIYYLWYNIFIVKIKTFLLLKILFRLIHVFLNNSTVKPSDTDSHISSQNDICQRAHAKAKGEV